MMTLTLFLYICGAHPGAAAADVCQFVRIERKEWSSPDACLAEGLAHVADRHLKSGKVFCNLKDAEPTDLASTYYVPFP